MILYILSWIFVGAVALIIAWAILAFIVNEWDFVWPLLVIAAVAILLVFAGSYIAYFNGRAKAQPTELEAR